MGDAPPADAGSTPPMLTADPPEAAVPAGGGVSTHQLTNPSGTRLAFKVRSSNNNDYRLKPVYGFVEASASTPIEITRTVGPPKSDKLVIQYKETPADASDASALFKDGAPLGEVTIPLNASHEPVIIVHGITNRADRFSAIRDHFISSGYSDAEVFGTTYGDAGKTNVLLVNMECDYVKRIRELIIAVSAYTSSTVDVLAFSMGSPIARKAIMGGICVDTNEQLGGALTALVDTFVGVAGANFGSFLCLIPFGSCNLNNGLHCNSRFLADINSRSRYEGAYIFTIYSTNDDKVGFQACGKIASAITDQNKGIQMSGMNHDQLMISTVGTQFNLVTIHAE